LFDLKVPGNIYARKVAEFLQKHPKAAWVNYAGLPNHPDHALAQKYLGGRASGLLTFGVKALATHPASTTHRQLSPEELVKAGVSEDTVRLSIGIEHIDDLLADLDQALAAV
jgi:O-acetylhomoserine (thiol)-lyase